VQRRPDRPRVALVCGDARASLDGVADYVDRLAAALPAAGVDPVVVTVRAGAVPGVVAAGRRWTLSGVAAVGRAVARTGADLVHVQFAPSAYGFSPAVGLLPFAVRRPLVTTVHEYGWWAWPPRVPAAAWRVVERTARWDRETLALVPRSARTLTTNAAHRAAVLDRFGLQPDRVPVVPLAPNVAPPGGVASPLPDGPQRRARRAQLGLPPEAELLVFFGFVHPVKGVRYLLEALAAVRLERPRLHLVVLGAVESRALPGEQARAFRAELDGLVAALGLGGAVTFADGHRPAEEVLRVLSVADLGVLPFTAGVTTKSGALLALLAAGLPVVATAPERDPGEDALIDGQTAVLVPARRDGGQLANALRRALTDAGLRHRVTAGGTALAGRRTWAQVAQSHAELYRQVLDDAG